MSKRIGFYAGSFDPFTNGHLHIVTQAAKVFDELVIGIGINPDKKRRFSEEKMKKAIEEVLFAKSLTNVRVIIYKTLSVKAAIECKATFFVRGIRNSIDYAYEEDLASFNGKYSNIETIYFRAGDLSNVSSSMVMSLLKFNEDISSYLPEEVLKLVEKEYKRF